LCYIIPQRNSAFIYITLVARNHARSGLFINDKFYLIQKFVAFGKYNDFGGTDVSGDYTWRHLRFKARRLGTMYRHSIQ